MSSAKQVSVSQQLSRSADDPLAVIERVFSLAASLPPIEQEKFVRAESSNPEIATEVLELLYWDQQDHQLLDLSIGECLSDGSELSLSKTRGNIPPVVAGYENLQFLAEGGQSIVYRAIQTSTRQKVVIKLLKSPAGPETGQRMRHEREIAVLSKLQHPNILSVLDCGTTEDEHDYYVARYIQGHDLDKYVQRTQLNPEQAVQLCVRIIEAMETAHRHGVIHRDLKPSNIRVDTNGQPLILDFGLAKAELPDRQTMENWKSNPGAFMGSVPWASPEQIDHRIGELSNRTDIYQLGLICYEVFSCGQLPYKIGDNILSAFATILNSQPVGLSELCEDEYLSPLDPVLLKAVAKSPAERFASAGEFALALSQVRFDSARPPVRGRSGRLARSIAIFSLLALAACLLWGTWIMPPKPDRNSPDDVSLADRTSDHLSLVLSSAEGNGTELRDAREPAVVKTQTNPEIEPPAEVASPPLGNSAGDGGIARAPSVVNNEPQTATIEGTKPAQSSAPKTTIDPEWGKNKPDRGFEQGPFGPKRPKKIPLGQLISQPDRLDFLKLKPGELPSGWEATGGVGLDFSEGIPGLGRTATGARDNLAICSNIRLGNKFFIEFQLVDATDCELGFILDATQTGERFHFTLAEQRSSAWALHSHGLKIPSLIPYFPRPDLWVYLEHVPEGLFITLNGDPASRQRIGEFQHCQFDQLQLDFNDASTVFKILNMRWGPNVNMETEPTLPFGNAIQRSPRSGVADGWSLVGNELIGKRRRYRSDKLQLRDAFQIDFEVEAKSSTTMSFNLVGAGSTISAPIHFYFHRGWAYITLGNQRKQFDATKVSHKSIRIQRMGDRLTVFLGDETNQISLDAKELPAFDYMELEVEGPPKGVTLLRLPTVRPLKSTQ